MVKHKVIAFAAGLAACTALTQPAMARWVDDFCDQYPPPPGRGTIPCANPALRDMMQTTHELAVAYLSRLSAADRQTANIEIQQRGTHWANYCNALLPAERAACAYRAVADMQQFYRTRLALLNVPPPSTIIPSVAPQPVAPHNESIPLRMVGNHRYIHGSVNGQGVEFTVDTGADDSTIPLNVASTLQLDIIDVDVFRDAGGHLNKEPIVMVRELTIGNYTLHNIRVGVSRSSHGLLGQDFFQHFKSYAIDNQRNALVLGEAYR